MSQNNRKTILPYVTNNSLHITHKLKYTNISNNITKFIAIYIKERKAYTLHNARCRVPESSFTHIVKHIHLGHSLSLKHKPDNNISVSHCNTQQHTYIKITLTYTA